jgi:hypothetical protein
MQWVWPSEALISQDSVLLGTSLGLRERLIATVLGLNYLPDATATLNFDDHFVYSLLAPLLALALGALLLNIDSLVGWSIVTWLVAMVVGVGLTVPIVPSWVTMVVLLPVIGLAVAFTLDRLRLLIMLNAGTWTLQATVYLALGLIVTAGFFGWIDYYNVAQRDSDLPSSVGRALRDAGNRPVALVSANVPLEEVLTDPVVQMLTARTDLAQLPTVNARNWSSMPPATRLLLAPGDGALQAAVESAYPGGSFTVMRDLHANPILYIYDMAGDNSEAR